MNIFKPYSVSQQFSVEDIRKKLQKAFLENDLKDVRFEFGIASFDKTG
ncbi:MAG: hypothetical protein IPP43_13375 [Chitinophagaceae bacterium]|nr:hypothetical protein [Chitinophagaceae bacterium]